MTNTEKVNAMVTKKWRHWNLA